MVFNSIPTAPSNTRCPILFFLSSSSYTDTRVATDCYEAPARWHSSACRCAARDALSCTASGRQPAQSATPQRHPLLHHRPGFPACAHTRPHAHQSIQVSSLSLWSVASIASPFPGSQTQARQHETLHIRHPGLSCNCVPFLGAKECKAGQQVQEAGCHVHAVHHRSQHSTHTHGLLPFIMCNHAHLHNHAARVMYVGQGGACPT